MDTQKKNILGDSFLPTHTYSDFSGTYAVEPLFSWAKENQQRWTQFNVSEFLSYLQLDTWSDSSSTLTSNISSFMKEGEQKKRVLEADLSFPLIVTNDGRIIDGVHRLFKAIYQVQKTITGVFIDQSELNKFQIDIDKILPPTNTHLPISDIYLRFPLSKLPEKDSKRRNLIECYFSEHLPTAERKENEWIIRLERPQEQYDCYCYDPNIHKALEWWKAGTKIHDVPFSKRFLSRGLLALEDQWMPLSWSRYFVKERLDEVILLHLDDHQDMMTPRLGVRTDGHFYDLITKDSVFLDKPESIEKAILSGAIGKGSILIPLIWSVKKVHIRHLSFRAHPQSHYKIEKITLPDALLSDKKNRISIRLEPDYKEALELSSNYVVSPDIEECFSNLPKDIPIFLHVDMDYFNDRFDGNSSWKTENKRKHEVGYEQQRQQIHSIASALKNKGLSERIVDTCIGISPGFYPGEFWPLTEELITSFREAGIKI